MRRAAKWAGSAIVIAGIVFATFNLAFELGADVAICVISYDQAGEPPKAIPACRRAEAAARHPVKEVRLMWLWARRDEVVK